MSATTKDLLPSRAADVAGRGRGLRRGIAILAILAAAFASPGRGHAATIEGSAPYPASAAITDMQLDWGTYKRTAQDSDNWPATWAQDGSVFSTWGDGGGFGQGAATKAYVSLGLARLTGDSARTLSGQNLIGGLNPSVAPCFPALGGLVDQRASAGRATPCAGKGRAGKIYSLLALDGTLYAWITPGSNAQAYQESRLHKAPIGTASWTRAAWAFNAQSGSPRIVSPMLMQAGQNLSGSDYVYAYAAGYAPVSGFGLQKGSSGGQIYLLRAPKGADLMQQGVWTFYAGSTSGGAIFNGQQSAAKPVFTDPNGVGWPIGATYVPELKRYLLVTQHERTFSGKIGVFEASAPEGPWRTVYYATLANAAADVPATTFYANFLPNAFGSDGKFTLLFTGIDKLDALNAVDGKFTLAAGAGGGTGTGSGTGTGTGTGSSGTDTGTGAGGTGTDTGSGSGTGTDTGASSGTDTGSDTGTATDEGSSGSTDDGSSTGTGDTGTSTGSTSSSGSTSGVGSTSTSAGSTGTSTGSTGTSVSGTTSGGDTGSSSSDGNSGGTNSSDSNIPARVDTSFQSPGIGSAGPAVTGTGGVSTSTGGAGTSAGGF